MSKTGKLLAIIGTATILAAFIGVLKPSIAPDLGIGSNRSIIITIIILAILAIYSLTSLRTTKLEQKEISMETKGPIEDVKEPKVTPKLQLDYQDEKQARKELRTLVKKIITREYGKDENFAEQAIQNQEWTNQKVSAAFIEPEINYPLIERLREWLEKEEEETLERRLKITTNSIENLHQQKDN